MPVISARVVTNPILPVVDDLCWHMNGGDSALILPLLIE